MLRYGSRELIRERHAANVTCVHAGDAELPVSVGASNGARVSTSSTASTAAAAAAVARAAQLAQLAEKKDLQVGDWGVVRRSRICFCSVSAYAGRQHHDDISCVHMHLRSLVHPSCCGVRVVRL